MHQMLLYLTPRAERCFLVPARHALAAGDFTVATLDGHQKRVDAWALRRFEVSREQAQAHVRAEIASAMAALSAAVDDAGAASRPAAPAGLDRIAGEIRGVAAGLSDSRPETVRNARATLARYGLDPGDSLDDLTGYLQATRRGEEPGKLGRRVDAAIERLERTMGPLAGLDASRQQQQEDYAQSARLSIAEALRASGITPLGAARAPLAGPG